MKVAVEDGRLTINEISEVVVGEDPYAKTMEHEDPNLAAFSRLMSKLFPIVSDWIFEQRDAGVPPEMMLHQAANVGVSIATTIMLNSVHRHDLAKGYGHLTEIMTKQLAEGRALADAVPEEAA